jgi:hypothetical protein
MGKANMKVTLPEGVSLQRLGRVLLDAWEAGGHQWKDTPIQLQEGAGSSQALPVPADSLDLFRLLAQRQVPYLLVGGMAMLTYVQGRNTKDVDLLMSVAAMGQVPELEVFDRKDFFVRGRFRTVQVNLLLTTSPLFKLVEERFSTRHRFAELEVPLSTADGLIMLKLYALPSLYRQSDWDRVYIFESDIKQLVARYAPDLEPLLVLLGQHLPANDLAELRQMLSEEQSPRSPRQASAMINERRLGRAPRLLVFFRGA